MTISPFNSLLRRRVNDVKALERWVAGQIKVDLHPVEEVRFSEQVKALPRYPRKVIVLHYVDDMRPEEIRSRGVNLVERVQARVGPAERLEIMLRTGITSSGVCDNTTAWGSK